MLQITKCFPSVSSVQLAHILNNFDLKILDRILDIQFTTFPTTPYFITLIPSHSFLPSRASMFAILTVYICIHMHMCFK
jgi:hypothetical protein